MADFPKNVQEQYSRDNKFYLSLMTHQRRALIEQVSAYWPLAKDLPDPQLASADDQKVSEKKSESQGS